MTTLGEARVRTKFNPSESGVVAEIKRRSAELINLCDELRIKGSTDGEDQSLWSLAQTHYEDAAMWAVKAATF